MEEGLEDILRGREEFIRIRFFFINLLDVLGILIFYLCEEYII